MQTIKLSLGIDLRVVVPQTFLDSARTESRADTATPFLKQLEAKNPEDDDAFIAGLVSNAVRIYARHALVDFLTASGVGGTVSPVSVEVQEYSPPLEDDEAAHSVGRQVVAGMRLNSEA